MSRHKILKKTWFFTIHFLFYGFCFTSIHPRVWVIFFPLYRFISSHSGVEGIFFFYGFISSHPEMWREVFLEKYMKFLFSRLCKFPPEIDERFFIKKICFLNLGLESSICQNKTFFLQSFFLFFELEKFLPKISFLKKFHFLKHKKFFNLRARKFHFPEYKKNLFKNIYKKIFPERIF